MTVAEVIEMLNEYPPDTKVIAYGGARSFFTRSEVINVIEGAEHEAVIIHEA